MLFRQLLDQASATYTYLPEDIWELSLAYLRFICTDVKQ